MHDGHAYRRFNGGSHRWGLRSAVVTSERFGVKEHQACMLCMHTPQGQLCGVVAVTARPHCFRDQRYSVCRRDTRQLRRTPGTVRPDDQSDITKQAAVESLTSVQAAIESAGISPLNQRDWTSYA